MSNRKSASAPYIQRKLFLHDDVLVVVPQNVSEFLGFSLYDTTINARISVRCLRACNKDLADEHDDRVLVDWLATFDTDLTTKLSLPHDVVEAIGYDSCEATVKDMLDVLDLHRKDPGWLTRKYRAHGYIENFDVLQNELRTRLTRQMKINNYPSCNYRDEILAEEDARFSAHLEAAVKEEKQRAQAEGLTRLQMVARGLMPDPYESHRLGEINTEKTAKARAAVGLAAHIAGAVEHLQRDNPGGLARSGVATMRGEDDRRAEEEARTRFTILADIQWED